MNTTEQKAFIRQKYDKIGAWQYDLCQIPIDFFITDQWRRRHFAKAKGKILEVAAGSGKNLHFYPRNADLLLTDYSSDMLERAQRRADKLKRTIKTQIMDAENLDLPDHSFDTVVSSLSICTYPDPIKALREIARVCKPDGQILLLEHGRSVIPWVHAIQKRFAKPLVPGDPHHWDRQPLELVKQASLKVLSSHNAFWGIFYIIKAKP